MMERLIANRAALHTRMYTFTSITGVKQGGDQMRWAWTSPGDGRKLRRAEFRHRVPHPVAGAGRGPRAEAPADEQPVSLDLHAAEGATAQSVIRLLTTRAGIRMTPTRDGKVRRRSAWRGHRRLVDSLCLAGGMALQTGIVIGPGDEESDPLVTFDLGSGDSPASGFLGPADRRGTRADPLEVDAGPGRYAARVAGPSSDWHHPDRAVLRPPAARRGSAWDSLLRGVNLLKNAMAVAAVPVRCSSSPPRAEHVRPPRWTASRFRRVIIAACA